MATYDGAAYLPEQLESIAAQTLLPDELVVCDDGSNDGRTREIVKAFANKAQFPVRLFVNRKNLGSKRSFDKAIGLCTGDIIFLCDQDDFWNDKKLARIAETFLSAPEVGLVFTDAEVVDEDLQILANSLWECVGFTIERQDLIKQGKAFSALLRDNAVTGATMAFRSELRRLVLPIPAETILQHDGWIALIIAAVARVVFLDEPLIKYRQHAKQQIGISITGSKYEQRESPLISSILESPYPQGKMDALKTAYARLVTKCSGRISTENLHDIRAWIIRLENEKAVLENDEAPVEMKKDWIEMKEDLESRIVEFEPYIWAELSRQRYRLRPRDLQGAVSAILAERLRSHKDNLTTSQPTTDSGELETQIESLSADLATERTKTTALEQQLAEENEKSATLIAERKRIADLEALLAEENEKSATLIAGQKRIAHLEALLAEESEKSATLIAERKRIAHLEALLAEENEKRATLTADRKQIAHLETLLAEQAEKSARLQAAERDLVDKGQELKSLRAVVLDKAESIWNLSGQVVEQRQRSHELAVEDEQSLKLSRRLAKQLAENERRLAEMVALLSEKEQVVATLSSQLVEHELYLERTKDRLATKETRAEEVSTSRASRLLTRYRSPKSRQLGARQLTESEEESTKQLQDSLHATPNPTRGSAESGLGSVTLTWNAAKATEIEIRVDAPDGSLLAHGTASGSLTTPEWVADGTIFYLQNVTGGLPLTAENTLASVTVWVERIALGSLVATPNPVLIYDGSGLAATTLAWNATKLTTVEVRVNAPDGELLVRGGASGNITTPKWVTDGTTFYLQNVSGGLPLTVENTLAKATVSVMNKREKVSSGSLFATPNPIRLYDGSGLEATTIFWDAIHAKEVELRLGACDGHLLVRGRARGTVTTPVSSAGRTILYLQDVSDGLPLTAETTLATLTVEVKRIPVGSLLATPNPVQTNDGSRLGVTTLRWKVTHADEVEIRAGSPNGDLLVHGDASGSITTPDPVNDGTVFYLQNVSGGLPLTSVNTLDTVTVLVGKQQARPSQRPSAIDVICFSIVDWDFRYQRPQQIMAQFAAHGHRVFYLSTTQSLPDDSSPRVQTRIIKENVWEVKLAARRLPSVYGEVIDGNNMSAFLDSLEELRRTFKVNEAVGYVMVSSWTAVALETRERFGWRVIYDCMDEWDNFPGIQRPLLDGELKLVKECDLLVVTAQTLYEKWQGQNRRIVLARNAVDYEFYASHYSPNSLLTEVTHPIIGYYGAIADWFDMELMIDVARQRPDYTFVLLGGLFDVDVSELQALPNVRLLGLQPYETMPQYLYHFDVCMIPFKINPITEATDPVKVYEYLSAGKPVVSVALPELSSYSEYLYIAKDKGEFVAQLDRAVMEDDNEMVARRISFASRQTWSERYGRIVDGLSSATPRASIVIVTYNNLELNKLCLESILRNTHYPNYEVVVVDNASTDGTRGYLRDMATQHSQIQVILNHNNDGFARANNQGIALGTGDYLVLLNNDTIVPSGWLSRLLRHLENPSIGMVGPVTNFVGNEAKISVPYQDWTELERFAQEHMWANDGKIAEIYMLAMFCVAFRRQTYELIGPLDEQFGIGMFEDDDYSLRMRKANLRVICAADVFVHHHGQAAFKKLIESGKYDDIFNENRRRYEDKWNVKWVPHQNTPLDFELERVAGKSKAQPGSKLGA
jgi:GT2 family glycosyltransferase/glycosyltransferase involved in cell wall biosynthesis